MTDQQAFLLLSLEAGGGRVPLVRDRMVLGRQPDCDIRINDLRVSRRHAEFFRDPFHRWWVRDLGSRNGTKVNESVIEQEQALSSGDVIGIETLSMTFVVGTATGIARKQGTGFNLTLLGDADSEVRSLEEVGRPQIDTEHIARLTELGSELLRIRDEDNRLRRLCQLMVHRDFRGRCAVVMRIRRRSAKDETPAPEILTDPVYAPGENPDLPHVSSTTLKAVQQRGAPVVASNVVGGSGVIAMSLAGDNIPLMSVVACPLSGLDGEALDVLYVTLPAECGTGEWLAMAQLACEEFRQAQEAWAARHAAAEHAVVERELERGREIQRRLLPRDLKVPGYEIGIGFEPCRWVGGDYVDVVRTGDGRTFFAVADVCGKGLQAALVTASIHTMVHTNVVPGFKLPELMRRLNDYLDLMLPDDSFVTMVAIVIHDQTGEIECINAGHPAPMILSSSGVRELQVGVNPPLAMDQHPLIWANDSIRTGDLLVLYTDGLSEFEVNDDLTGTDVVSQRVIAHRAEPGCTTMPQLAERLLRGVQKSDQRTMQIDDRTVLLVHRLEPPVTPPPGPGAQLHLAH